MLTRVRHQVVRPWIRRLKGAALVVALFAVPSTSSAFAQCRGGSGGMGGSGGPGGGAGMTGTGMAGLGIPGAGIPNGLVAAMGQGQSGQGQRGQGFFAIPTDQMLQPAFQPIVDDNRQYVAARRALRAAKVEQARQRLASRKERPVKTRIAAADMPRE